MLINLVHIFITGAFLVYLGISETKTPNWAFIVALVLGILVALRWLMLWSVSLFPIIHVLIVAPLLIGLGIMKNKSPKWMFKVSMMVGFAAIGYHATKLL